MCSFVCLVSYKKQNILIKEVISLEISVIEENIEIQSFKQTRV